MPDIGELPESFDGALKLGRQVAESVYYELANHGVPFFVADPIATFIGAIPLTGGLIFASVLALVRNVIAPIAVDLLKIISELRRDAAPQLAAVAGEVMGEFLGFTVSAEHLSQEEGFAGNVQRANVLGSALHDLLTREFAPAGVVTPATGAAAARTFSGYNINFAAQNAILALFFDMASIHQAEQIRELGVEVATNLGLGRLHRSAMKPLIDNLIVHPYTKFMNDKYVQQGLSEQQLCQAYLSQSIDRAVLRQGLRNLGYDDGLHDVLISFYAPQMTVGEVHALIKSGFVTPDVGMQMLRKQGWNEAFAANKLSAVDAQETLRHEREIVSTLTSLVKDRYMDTATFASELSKLHLSDTEQQLILRNTGTYLEHQYRHFTLAEVIYMVDRNIITEQDVDDWAASIGFNAQDRATLALFFASKELDYEQQVQAKKDAAAKKAAPKPPKPPTTPPPATG